MRWGKGRPRSVSELPALQELGELVSRLGEAAPPQGGSFSPEKLVEDWAPSRCPQTEDGCVPGELARAPGRSPPEGHSAPTPFATAGPGVGTLGVQPPYRRPDLELSPCLSAKLPRVRVAELACLESARFCLTPDLARPSSGQLWEEGQVSKERGAGGRGCLPLPHVLESLRPQFSL